MSVTHLTKSTFTQEVLQSDRPVLIDFFATWCGPCKMMSPILDDFAQSQPGVKVCKVDVDQEPDLAREFGVMSIPTLVVIKDGKLANRAVGLQSKSALAALVKG